MNLNSCVKALDLRLSLIHIFSSLLGALFFLGYFFFQIPGAIYAERRSVRKLIFICLILWGGCASLTGIVHNICLLYTSRCV